MRVIVGCEESQVVTKAFRERGIEAYSCDLQDCSGGRPEWHIKGDILDNLEGWDLGIFHPDCTYLTNAANKWLFEDSSKCTVEERLVLRGKAIEFFIKLQDAPIDKIAIENPQPHPYVTDRVGRFTDKVQPWMFGDPETKGVCWWLKNLPPLMSTVIETTREDLKHRLPPGPERAKLRSKFFPLMAKAMAVQWGDI
tara:strand:+ start:278 stop:865 length:588 start_codon:yes stop_codon:yes gene_type:complete